VTDSTQFALLGTLAATRSGRPLNLGPRRQCALLAVLLCQPNQVVRTDVLMRAVWDDECPASGPRLVSTYVYRLRRVFGGVGGRPEIESIYGGYRLRLESGGLDTVRFAAGVARARDQRANGRLDDARASLAEALSLWRGEPFSGLPGPALAAERLRLEEERLAALELRAELDLRCGTGDLGAGELRALSGRYPLREHLAALLMTALYRSGRQADALSVYADTTNRLRTELGVRPGKELANVHQAVLRGDDAALGDMGDPPNGRDVVRSTGRGRDDLPAGSAHFAGREREIGTVMSGVRFGRTSASVTAIDGMPGVGKTALVLEVAARLRARHPGGRYYLDLHAHRPGGTAMHPHQALRCLLAAAGHPPGALPDGVEERAALWRDTVAGRGVLLVLDDVECTDQVLPLLPSAPDCTVLVAGRRRLPALSATTVLSLAPLDVPGGRALLGRAIGEGRAGREPQCVRDLVESCGGLPALLADAAGRLRHRPSLTVADLVARLRRPGGLLRLAPADARGVDALLDPSWLRLGDAEQRALRTLAVASGTVREPAPAEVMEALVEANLVEEPAAGGYRLHPLIEAYVEGQFARAQAGTAALVR